MMRRLAFALTLMLGTLPVFAQTPATVSLTANYVTIGGGGANVPDGSKLCVITTDAQDHPAGYRIGSTQGQTTSSVDYADCRTIANGAISSPLTVINSAASSPLNACLRVFVKDPTGTEIMRRKCVQTGTAEALANWCSIVGSGETCNLDWYPLGSAPVDQVIMGGIGPQGPPGCVVGTTCSANFTPQALGAQMYTDAFGNSDIADNFTAAWNSQAGTSVSPTAAAMLHLSPNKVYQTSKQVLLAPSAGSSPYIKAPQVDCHDSVIVSSYTGSDEAFKIVGQNANNSAADSGWMQNCILVRANQNGPVVRNNGRLGYRIENTTLNSATGSGSTVLYDVQLGSGGSGVGYTEQTYLHNVAYVCGGAQDTAIYVHNGTGSDGGHLYNTYTKQRIQDCREGLHIGTGVNAFGLTWDYQMNNGIGGVVYPMDVDGTVLSSHMRDSGELTNGTTMDYRANGIADMDCDSDGRIGGGTIGNFVCNSATTTEGNGSGQFGIMTGIVRYDKELSFLNYSRASLFFANGRSLEHIGSNYDGNGFHGTTERINCDPPADGKVGDQVRTLCDNVFSINGEAHYGNQIAVGPGFFGDRQSATSTSPVPRFTFHVHGSYGSTPIIRASDTTDEMEQNFWDTNGDFVHQSTIAGTAGQPNPHWNRFDFYWGGTTAYNWGIRYRGHGDGTAEVQINGSTTMPSLAGTGSALMCVDSAGTFYRGTATTCP